MKLTTYSNELFKRTANEWRVDDEFYNPMYNYLVHGYSPGSFFTAVLANDALSAFQRSHPSNTITALKALSGWIRAYFPREAYGSYLKVDEWTTSTVEFRRAHLEHNRLVYAEADEIMLTLKG